MNSTIPRFILIFTNASQPSGYPPQKLYCFIEVLIDPYITTEEYRFELYNNHRTNIIVSEWSAPRSAIEIQMNYLDKDKYYLVKCRESEFEGENDIIGYINIETGEISEFPDQEIANKMMKDFFYQNTVLWM
jgi:hypothetical protein